MSEGQQALRILELLTNPHPSPPTLHPFEDTWSKVYPSRHENQENTSPASENSSISRSATILRTPTASYPPPTFPPRKCASCPYRVLGDHNDRLERSLTPQSQDVVLEASATPHEDDVAGQARGQGGRVEPKGVRDAAGDRGHLLLGEGRGAISLCATPAGPLRQSPR